MAYQIQLQAAAQRGRSASSRPRAGKGQHYKNWVTIFMVDYYCECFPVMTTCTYYKPAEL
jgi:hypothetical protein